MQRRIMADLLAWKNKRSRKPLVLQGARQVGKTYIVEEFGRVAFEDYAYFDLSKSNQAASVFEGDLEPEKLLADLSLLHGKKIIPGKTLLVLDEIQVSERAVVALKYFCQDLQELHVVAAGSLLGVAVNRQVYSFPVGKVDLLEMHPMDFEEYLIALGKQDLVQAIYQHYESNEKFMLHDMARDLYRSYLFVGGLPEAVKVFVESGTIEACREIHLALDAFYVVDMSKYIKKSDAGKAIDIWQSIPRQLARENNKFQYKIARKDGRASDLEGALAWLSAAGLINPCFKVEQGTTPLLINEDRAAFKTYMLDTGLLCTKFDLDAYTVLKESATSTNFGGALVENYVMQQLVARGIQPNYWGGSGKPEVDFLFQDAQSKVVPVEVKKSSHTKSRSLNLFVEKYHPAYALRIADRNFGFANGIKSVPLYAAFCIHK